MSDKNPPPNPPNPPEKAKKVKARVLVDCQLGKVNDVVSVDAAEVSALAGLVDPHPSAVAYAEKLAKATAAPAADDDAPLE